MPQETWQETLNNRESTSDAREKALNALLSKLESDGKEETLNLLISENTIKIPFPRTRKEEKEQSGRIDNYVVTILKIINKMQNSISAEKNYTLYDRYRHGICWMIYDEKRATDKIFAKTIVGLHRQYGDTHNIFNAIIYYKRFYAIENVTETLLQQTIEKIKTVVLKIKPGNNQSDALNLFFSEIQTRNSSLNGDNALNILNINSAALSIIKKLNGDVSLNNKCASLLETTDEKIAAAAAAKEASAIASAVASTAASAASTAASAAANSATTAAAKAASAVASSAAAAAVQAASAAASAVAAAAAKAASAAASSATAAAAQAASAVASAAASAVASSAAVAAAKAASAAAAAKVASAAANSATATASAAAAAAAKAASAVASAAASSAAISAAAAAAKEARAATNSAAATAAQAASAVASAAASAVASSAAVAAAKAASAVASAAASAAVNSAAAAAAKEARAATNSAAATASAAAAAKGASAVKPKKKKKKEKKEKKEKKKKKGKKGSMAEAKKPSTTTVPYSPTIANALKESQKVRERSKTLTKHDEPTHPTSPNPQDDVPPPNLNQAQTNPHIQHTPQKQRPIPGSSPQQSPEIPNNQSSLTEPLLPASPNTSTRKKTQPDSEQESPCCCTMQ